MAELIYNGITYESEIVSGAGGLELNHAMVGETLTVDSLSVQLVTGDVPDRFVAADQTEDDWFITADGYELVAHGENKTPVAVTNGAGQCYVDDDLIGQYYFTELHRTGTHEHALTFYSAVWLLELSWHVGGLYTGQTAGDILDDIIGDVPHTIDDDIAAIQVYGYLPYARRRANLQMALMAIGGAVRNAAGGSLRITSLTDTVAGVFDESRVFVGGSIVDKNPATAVQVTEHNYLETTETTETATLFNDSTITTETVIFKEPYHDLSITGGTITASGVNFCTFTASGAVVLTGQKYQHVTRVITFGTTPTGAASDNVKSVVNNTLLTPNNAVIVAEKLYDYLSVAQSLKAEVLFGTERPGDVVSIVHPYTLELVEACAKPMSISFGATELRAAAEFLVGYKPPGAIAGFQNYVVLTGAGTWTVPAGVTRIRVILVGNGEGAGGGNDGEDGTFSASGVWTNGHAGVGGTGGEKGLSGLIFEINNNVSPGADYNYSCPDGGLGGLAGITGETGEATLFGDLSSAFGRRFPYGYYEPKSGLTFGTDGIDGVSGGTGHGINNDPGTNLTYNGITYTIGQDGQLLTSNGITAYPGLGGGPAVGSNGENGTNGRVEYIWGNWQRLDGNGGNGGDGSEGSDGTGYGSGGSGGHGGGGGGQSCQKNITWGSGYPGIGGTGGAGGDGGSGAIVIYY